VTWRSRSSESPAHRVQILDDIDESLHGADALCGNPSGVIVRGVQPVARLGVVAANESIERAIEAEKKKGELAFLASGIEAAAASEARYGRFARADYLSELLVAKAEPLGG
jgi:hypothetical protein